MPTDIAAAAKISIELKSKCVDYVLENFEDDLWASRQGKEFASKYKGADVIIRDQEEAEKKWISVLDNFLLFGETEAGVRVLSALRKKMSLNKTEKVVLQEWEQEAFDSVFEILEVHDDYLIALDTVGEAQYKIYPNRGDFSGFPRVAIGCFLASNLLPVQGIWFFSGSQVLFSSKQEEQIFKKFVEKANSPKRIYRNNPEKLAEAFELQKKYYDFFVKHFGSYEVLLHGSELPKAESDFHAAWAAANGNGSSKVSSIRDYCGIDSEEDVAMIAHEQEGIHFVVDYGELLSIFQRPDKRPSDWRETVRFLLTDECIPTFIFFRLRERYPIAFREVLREVGSTWKKDFDPDTDLEDLFDDLQPNWREIYPGTCPLNKRFRKYYIQDALGRNDLCFCGSGKKFKKCCR